MSNLKQVLLTNFKQNVVFRILEYFFTTETF